MLSNDAADHKIFKYQRWAVTDGLKPNVTSVPLSGIINYKEDSYPSNTLALSYETVTSLDEEGYLYIEGTAGVANHVSEIRIKDIGDWGGEFIIYEVDAVVEFDLKSTEPLSAFTEEELEILKAIE